MRQTKREEPVAREKWQGLGNDNLNGPELYSNIKGRPKVIQNQRLR